MDICRRESRQKKWGIGVRESERLEESGDEGKRMKHEYRITRIPKDTYTHTHTHTHAHARTKLPYSCFDTLVFEILLLDFQANSASQ